MSFESLGLAPELVRVVADAGYTEPTPVQRQAIPLALAGRDLLAGAQTGTGKTAAFVLPMLQRLHASDGGSAGPGPLPPNRGPVPTNRGQARGGPVRGLVLTPTRELALQVEESVRTYGARRPIRSVAIYGGVGFEPQARALRAGPGIVVATPGRLLDHLGQGTLDLSHVEILVLDEADRMLDMGFIRDIRRVLALLPPQRQNLLFSATFSSEIRALAGGFLDQPATVDVAPRNTAAELVEQVVIRVDRERKRELLSSLVRSGRIDQALVFTRTKHGANRLMEQLVRDGISAAAIHGNRSQAQRVRALADFKQGRLAVLVATDIAARGIDIDALPHVVNFELPMVPEDYVHRIGRTGRAGIGGQAVSLVCVDEAGLLRDIEALLRHPIPSEVVPGFEPDRSIRPEPIRLRTAGSPGGGAGRLQGGTRSPGRSQGPVRPAAARPAREPFRGGPDRGRPIDGGARPLAARPHPNGAGRPNAVGQRPAASGGQRPGTSIGQRPAAVSGHRFHGTPEHRPGAHPPRVPVTLPGERFARTGSRGPGGA